MARREIVQYFDDLDNSLLTEEQRNVVNFAFDGTDYVLDLSDRNYAEFRKVMKRYIDVAHKPTESSRGVRRRSGATTANAQESKKIREWAHANNIKVASRGKIAAEIVEAYYEQNGK